MDSGDTYINNVATAVANATDGIAMRDVDRALSNALRQRFDLGLFDPEAAYAWPGADDVGTVRCSFLFLSFFLFICFLLIYSFVANFDAGPIERALAVRVARSASAAAERRRLAAARQGAHRRRDWPACHGARGDDAAVSIQAVLPAERE